MRRRLAKLVVFLLFGAVVNVAVCWVISARPIHHRLLEPAEVGYTPIGEHGFWMISHDKSLGRVRLSSSWAFEWMGSLSHNPSSPPAHQLVPDWATKIANLQPTKINDADIVAEATGWPFLAMIAHYERGVYVQDASGKYHSQILAPRGLVISDPSDRDGRILPLHPIWSGFAVNTLFYSALLWLPFGPFAIRRIIRRKRGYCIKCGYDLRDDLSAGCPECGWRREDVS